MGKQYYEYVMNMYISIIGPIATPVDEDKLVLIQ